MSPPRGGERLVAVGIVVSAFVAIVVVATVVAWAIVTDNGACLAAAISAFVGGSLSAAVVICWRVGRQVEAERLRVSVRVAGGPPRPLPETPRRSRPWGRWF